MPDRLDRIYTRTGDAGSTGLADGSRVAKTDPRIEAIGDVDELNCCIGLVLAETRLHAVSEVLTDVQHDLFEVGAALGMPDYPGVGEARVAELERALDAFNGRLPTLEEFILPGGGRAAAQCHLARAVCRRAERRLWALADQAGVAAPALRYLNRLSDLLFVAARLLARDEGQGEVFWQR